MEIQDELRQWSSSTLDKNHCDVGFAAADRIDELVAAIKVLRQTVIEVRHAQRSGPGWYTKGDKGLYLQVDLHLNRGEEAIKPIIPFLNYD